MATTVTPTKIEQLRPLVGTWAMTGRTLGAAADDISGTVRIDWSIDDSVLTLSGDQTIQDKHFRTLEVIWYDGATDALRSHVYLGGGADPLDYRWNVDAGVFIHAGGGATYRGTLSDDGATLTGGWRPDPGTEATAESAYDVTMCRVG